MAEYGNSYLCNKLRNGHFFRTSGKIAKRAQRVSQRTRVTEKMAITQLVAQITITARCSKILYKEERAVNFFL